MSPLDPFAETSGVDVRRLRYFVAIAEELHFGRASERLNVAQPALSRQMVELEAAIGATLFDRTRNQIRLTVAGEALLPRARQILSSIVEAARIARRAAAGSIGVLNVGFVGSATYSLLPRVLNAFRTDNPDVDLMLHAMNTAELKGGLIERTIDVAFARPGIDDPEVVDELLLEEPLVVALPDVDPQAAHSEIALGDLARHAFVLYPRFPRPSFADIILKHCAESGFSPIIAHETMDVQTALGLVAAGAGVSLVPASVQDAQRLGVAYRPLRAPVPTTRLSLSYRRDNRSATLARFRSQVKAFAAAHKTRNQEAAEGASVPLHQGPA
ncbi:MAG: LysR family transcriptional regulator [Candidatus Brevundimonas phytovorans]|nr:LysR family transcriptional regulator [Brevundimonas sp.]WEK58565.1 MAG: LysR family transcriptional regulator [Brevundimonas sp.]